MHECQGYTSNNQIDIRSLKTLVFFTQAGPKSSVHVFFHAWFNHACMLTYICIHYNIIQNFNKRGTDPLPNLPAHATSTHTIQVLQLFESENKQTNKNNWKIRALIGVSADSRQSTTPVSNFVKSMSLKTACIRCGLKSVKVKNFCYSRQYFPSHAVYRGSPSP